MTVKLVITNRHTLERKSPLSTHILLEEGRKTAKYFKQHSRCLRKEASLRCPECAEVTINVRGCCLA
jgi:hypothetical protein